VLSPQELAARYEEKLRQGEAGLVKTLLAHAVTPSDGAGLVFALGQRASDLFWTLVVENRGNEPLEVAADPTLLRFELGTQQSDEPPAPGEKPTSQPAAKVGAPSAPRPVVCGPATPPRSVGDDAYVRLEPGESFVHSFDPRSLCPELALQKGLWVRASYGFPVAVKKVWAKGKASEVPQLDQPPFVARRPGETAPAPAAAQRASTEPSGPPPLPKELIAAPFELDETYPLEGVFAEARQEPGAAQPGQVPETAGSSPATDGDPTKAGASPTGAPPAPPPPALTLRVSPLGSVSEIDETTVTFTVKNQSKKSVSLFLRRELMVYEILGPKGAATCRMGPAGRAPDKSSFDAIGPGGSRTLTTRMAEACPPGTFSAPGTYAVSGRLEARDDGAEHGLAAFTGNVSTTQPARFVVRGKAGAPAQAFRVNKKN
jgi:hypothetical protein